MTVFAKSTCVLRTVAIVCFLFSKITFAHSIYAMADLWVSDWDKFRNELRQAKELGIEGISVDVWWGRVQAESEDRFDWSYYHRIFREIREAKLRVIPIMSTHSCGGNVGDNVNIPLPQWFMDKHRNSGIPIEFTSGAGNHSYEYPSFWTTDEILPDFVRFWAAFQREFYNYRDIISEIPISLGPSGELHYPSHHSHDQRAGYQEAYYPNRGLLQAFSPAAHRNFQKWIYEKKYPGMNARQVGNIWGFASLPDENISPWLILYPHIPNDPRWRVDKITEFFQQKKQFSSFGRDFFEWYHLTLMEHLEKVMGKAAETFHSGEFAFRGAPLSAKIPGVHWGANNGRLPSIMSGLVSIHEFDVDLGYRDVFEAFARLRRNYKNSSFSMTYTASEFADTWDSNAETITQLFIRLSREYGISLDAENALASSLFEPASLDRLMKQVDQKQAEKLVLLRLSDVLASQSARHQIGLRKCSNLLTK